MKEEITLFLYNAHTYSPLRSRFDSRFRSVIEGKKYFHGCGTADSREEKGEEDRGNLLEAKITRRYKFTVKTESFRHVLVPPLSLSDVYRRGCSRPRQSARVK